MSLPQTGVTMSAVHAALGVFITGITYSLPYCTLSDLVQVGSINKWSKTKPIRHVGNTLSDTYSGLTGVMATANYGFDFTDGTEGTPKCYGDTENEALTIASTASTWIYDKWTPSADYPARLGDFRGYNHSAISPFQKIFVENVVPGVEDYIPPTFQLMAVNLSNAASPSSNNYNANAEINPKDMGEFNSGEYMLLWRKKGTNSTSATTPVNLSSLTIDSGVISGTTSVTGTFETCLAIHRRGGTGGYYPCDGTYRTFEVRTQTKEEYIGLYLTNQCRMTVSSSNAKPHLFVQMTLTNITDSAITAKVYCQVKGTHDDALWQSTGITYSPNFTVPAHGSLTIYGTENNTFSTEPQGEIVIDEGVSHFGSPITADCRARNTSHGVITVGSVKTIYTA